VKVTDAVKFTVGLNIPVSEKQAVMVKGGVGVWRYVSSQHPRYAEFVSNPSVTIEIDDSLANTLEPEKKQLTSEIDPGELQFVHNDEIRAEIAT
jgi:hypothetical protein